MSQPINRNPHLKIFLDFRSIWPILDNTNLTFIQKQNLIYHIFSCMEIELSAVMFTIHNIPMNDQDDLFGGIDSDKIAVLTMAIYNLMSYNNLFVLEVNDDSCGLVREFPWGALHVDETKVVLVGEGLPKAATAHINLPF